MTDVILRGCLQECIAGLSQAVNLPIGKAPQEIVDILVPSLADTESDSRPCPKREFYSSINASLSLVKALLGAIS